MEPRLSRSFTFSDNDIHNYQRISPRKIYQMKESPNHRYLSKRMIHTQKCMRCSKVYGHNSYTNMRCDTWWAVYNELVSAMSPHNQCDTITTETSDDTLVRIISY